MKLPEVITPTGDTLTDEEWKEFKNVILHAIEDLDNHRADEGKSLEQDLLLRIDNISKKQEEVLKLEPLRQVKIREGIKKLLEEHVGKDNYDENKLEQELVYYIEKIDISEEQVRLKNHCDYFKVILAEPEEGKGKENYHLFYRRSAGRSIPPAPKHMTPHPEMRGGNER